MLNVVPVDAAVVSSVDEESDDEVDVVVASDDVEVVAPLETSVVVVTAP